MHLRRKLCAVLGALTLLATTTAAAQDVIKIGILPRKPAVETRAAFEPLAKRLSAATGKKCELLLSSDYKAFWAAVQRREFDVVHFNQYQYVKSHKELAYDVVLVNEEEGSARMSSAWAVRTDSPIRSVADLRGKKVLYGGNKQSMQGYIGPVHLLKQAGVKDGEYQEAFAVNTANALIGVYQGTADAAAVGDHLLNHASMKNKIDVSRMRILAKGEPLPGLAWAVKRELGRDVVKAIVNTMSGLAKEPQGPAVLRSADVTGFVPASDNEFDPVRKAVKAAIGEEY